MVLESQHNHYKYIVMGYLVKSADSCCYSSEISAFSLTANKC